jgi:hypothetical protein
MSSSGYLETTKQEAVMKSDKHISYLVIVPLFTLLIIVNLVFWPAFMIKMLWVAGIGLVFYGFYRLVQLLPRDEESQRDLVEALRALETQMKIIPPF